MTNNVCPLCAGSRRWQDDVACQTIICPLCEPINAEHQGLVKNSVRAWIPELERMDAKHFGPRMQVDPWLLVIHSGESAPGVAEYFANCDRVVSTQIAWSREHNDFVQCVPLNRVAWHVGGSRYNGHRRLNFCSIGIELPGPWDKERSDAEYLKLKKVLELIVKYAPSIKTVVQHSDINPNKRDLGKFLDWNKLQLDYFGLVRG